MGLYLAEGKSETNGYVDIERSSALNQNGSKEIAFTALEILNSAGARCSHLAFGEPTIIRITVKLARELKAFL